MRRSRETLRGLFFLQSCKRLPNLVKVDMSLFQVARRPGRIRIAVDTLTVGVESPNRVHASKFFALPHAHSVVAFRGAQLVWANILAYLAPWPVSNAADVLDNLPDLIAAVSEQFRMNPNAQEIKRAGHSFTCEMLVAGRGRNGELICHLAEVDLEAGSVRSREVIGDASAPGVPADYSDDASHRRVARSQLARMRELSPELVSGGHLLMVEMTAKEIRFRDLGEIEGG